MTMVAPYTTGALAGFGRRRRMLMRAYPRFMGQAPVTAHWYDGVVNAFQNVVGGLPTNAPEAGGGWVTVPNPADTTTKLVQGVDPNGQPTTYTVPADWTPDQITQNLGISTGAGTTPPIIPPAFQIPTWAWWALGLGGIALLLGFSGLGKLIPRANPVHRRRRHTRQRARSRR